MDRPRAYRQASFVSICIGLHQHRSIFVRPSIASRSHPSMLEPTGANCKISVIRSVFHAAAMTTYGLVCTRK